MPKRIRLKEYIMAQYKDLRNSILNGLGSSTKVLIALNNWTSSNYLAFMAITVYYINEA